MAEIIKPKEKGQRPVKKIAYRNISASFYRYDAKKTQTAGTKYNYSVNINKIWCNRKTGKQGMFNLKVDEDELMRLSMIINEACSFLINNKK